MSHPLSHQNACKCSAGTSTSALCRYAALRTPAERAYGSQIGAGDAIGPGWLIGSGSGHKLSPPGARILPNSAPPPPDFLFWQLFGIFLQKRQCILTGSAVREREVRCHAARPNARRFACGSRQVSTPPVRSGECSGARHGTEPDGNVRATRARAPGRAKRNKKHSSF